MPHSSVGQSFGRIIPGLLLFFIIACSFPPVSIGAPPDGIDPFADLEPPATSPTADPSQEPWWAQNTQFRRELFLQTVARDVTYQPKRTADTSSEISNRHSIGFEWLRRFQSETSTIGSCDLQARLVRRDGYVPIISDREGEDRIPWAVEYHNAYCDLYNPASFLVGAEQASSLIGVANLRIGRFYLPLGLNLATDTHGTVLQLSNDQNIGFERDWYAGFWGNLTEFASYDLYYLFGSGYDFRFAGQSGLLGVRVGTSTSIKNRYGLEAGVGALVGERLASPHQAAIFDGSDIIRTMRVGPDLRYIVPTERGSFTLTNELSVGSDNNRSTVMQLHQFGYLTNNRQLGANLQLRQQWLDQGTPSTSGGHHHHPPTGALVNTSPLGGISRSIIYDIAWYFTNDIANANLHWMDLSVEQIISSPSRGSGSIVSLQYYRYW